MLFARAELGRSKFRFGLLTFGAGLLVFVLLFQQALLNTVLDGMSGALTHQSAPVLVYSREAQRSFSASLIAPDQRDAVTELPGVARVSELAVTLLAYRGPDSDERINVSMIGYRPGQPGSPTGLRSGRLPESPGEVVASAEDAVGRFGVGDTITIEPGGTKLAVVGLTEGGRWGVGPTMWTPWESYEQLVRQASPDTAVVLPTALAVEPDAGLSTPELVRQVNDRAPDLEALSREDAAEKIPGRSAVRLSFLAVMALGYLVVAAVIGFFFLTMTLQKESSITLLRAVGARSGYLARGLLFQVVMVTLGGLVIGGLMLLIVKPLIQDTIAISVQPQEMLTTAVPALAVALLGAVPPLRRMLRVDPHSMVSSPTLGGVG